MSQNPQSGTSPEVNVMPKWLNSMSKDDGIPEWLEPIRPKNTAAAQVGVGRHFGRKIKQRKIIYAVGVHGALIELEKWVPTAGLAMVQIFFPLGLSYSPESIRDNVHKNFWNRAYSTWTIRKRAEEKRREEERELHEVNKGRMASLTDKSSSYTEV